MPAVYPPFSYPIPPSTRVAPQKKKFWAAEFSMEISLSLVSENLEKILFYSQYVCLQKRMSNVELPFGSSVQFSSFHSLSRVRLFATPWTTARQASLSITNSRSLLKLISIELVMPSSHLILCRPLLLLPSIFPSIRVFSNVSSSYQVAKVLEFQLQHQSLQRTPRTDFF